MEGKRTREDGESSSFLLCGDDDVAGMKRKNLGARIREEGNC